jgi:hypothetical protein
MLCDSVIVTNVRNRPITRMTAEPTPVPRPEPELPESEDQRLALRRITQQLNRLRAELDALNRARSSRNGRLEK